MGVRLFPQQRYQFVRLNIAGDTGMSLKHPWNDIDRGKLEFSEKTLY
jgi:hypothetical protein